MENYEQAGFFFSKMLSEHTRLSMYVIGISESLCGHASWKTDLNPEALINYLYLNVLDYLPAPPNFWYCVFSFSNTSYGVSSPGIKN
jgi:hypothetical protein